MARRHPSPRGRRNRLTVNPRDGLPEAIAAKLYKTAQTRGADKDEIYQNRVLRNNTALIPLGSWRSGGIVPPGGFENGFIVLATPTEYFSDRPPTPRQDIHRDLVLGGNLVVFYETRRDWTRYPPDRFGWTPAGSRRPPIGGQYVARIPATTRTGEEEIREGFAARDGGGQGAGIRVYEYASRETFNGVWYQLAYLAWRTSEIETVARQEGTQDPAACRAAIERACHERQLDSTDRLEAARVLRNGQAVCPLCLKPIAAIELATRVQQAEGRTVPDITITPANLFHVHTLITGEYNHVPYNVGWGHHRCNSAAADLGIDAALEWMKGVLARNGMLLAG